MTSDAFRMNTEHSSGATTATSPKHLTRPRLMSYQSSSLPATPRQHAQEFSNNPRSPSPTTTAGHHSPRSVSSEINRHTSSLRPTNPSCRFQSTQTSRRRIPYTIGADILDADIEQSQKSLTAEQEQSLSKDLHRLYDNLLPSAASQESRKKVVQKLKAILQDEWPERDVEVYMFGSSGNLLYTDKSDVDICITMRGVDTVCSLAEVLAKRGMRGVTCVHAKAVPIVKIWDPQLQIACDLNVNNHVALKNTRLVRAYMELDRRVRPLAMIVKYWTKRRIINEASGGTLSSYTWTLLVINFLQTREKPVLPVLSLHNEHDRPKHDFAADIERLKDFGKDNDETLGELFFHFFRRYGHELDYEKAVVSVRNGTLLTKEEKNWVLANNNRLCVEEPFNTDRNLANTADDTAFRGLHLEMRQAFARIVEGKNLVSDVCGQFEFPAEEPRPVFERPQPGPRPILSRSTSQSGRGNRSGGGRRGNRQQYDHRTGVNGRRSSSAAAFGHNGPQGFHSPQIVLPSNDYLLQQQQEELSRLSRQMSVEEQNLRYRQFQIMQAQAFQQLPGRGTNSPIPTQQRPVINGYPSPRLSHAEPVPGSAPLVGAYPLPPSFESPVAMSHSSSQQGTNTNPNSPLLAPTTPNRRGFQRNAAVSSPGAAVRSQSQPARPMAPPLVQQTHGRPQFGQMIYPPMQGTGTWPAHLPRPAYFGPYMGPYGGYYMAIPNAENLPREYLGYGIGAGPQSGQASQEAAYGQAQPVEEFAVQDSSASPSRRHSLLNNGTLEPARSPSPLPRPDLESNGMHSASLNGSFSSYQHHTNLTPRPSEDLTPVIVNGSYPVINRSQTSDQDGDNDQRRLSDSTRVSQVGSELSLADDALSHHERGSSVTDLQFGQESFPGSVGDNTPIAESGSRTIEYTPAIVSSDNSAVSRSSVEMPPPPRPQHYSTFNHSPSFQISPESANGIRRSSGNRNGIPPLDLGASSSERSKDSAPTTSTVLSPVEETRTPSPVNSRKHVSRKSVQMNGIVVPTPPTPLPSKGEKSENQKDGVNGNTAKKGGHGRNSSVVNVGTSAAQVTGQWQKAAGGKKNKKKGSQQLNEGLEKKGKGEALPVNEAARKGG